MKKLLLAAALLVASHSFSQTTQEEYNYVTRGYIDVINRGLDVKNNYQVNLAITGPESSGVFNKHKFVFYSFVNKTTNTTQATIVVYYKNGTVNTILCMPTANSEGSMWNDYFAKVQALGVFEASLLAECTSFMYMQKTK